MLIVQFTTFFCSETFVPFSSIPFFCSRLFMPFFQGIIFWPINRVITFTLIGNIFFWTVTIWSIWTNVWIDFVTFFAFKYQYHHFWTIGFLHQVQTLVREWKRQEWIPFHLCVSLSHVAEINESNFQLKEYSSHYNILRHTQTHTHPHTHLHENEKDNGV